MAPRKSATSNAALKDSTDKALLAMEANLTGSKTDARLPDVDDTALFPADPVMSIPAPANEPRMELPASVRAPEATVQDSANEPAAQPQPRETRQRDTLPLPRSVANDDRRDVAMILAALNRKPSGTPLFLAALGSIAWLGIVGYNYYTSLWAPLPANLRTLETLPWPQIAMAAMVLLVPVIAMFVIAGLYRRSAEMKNSSRVMADVAMRLAQPETIAADQVATLSQAIRRELASLGDGIERSLGRAGELETLVHREVTALERSYSDNEARIRILVDELVTQREAIHTNAERVRLAIVGAHDSLTTELAGVGTRVADSVSFVGSNVAQQLDQRRDEITTALSQTGEAMLSEIGTRSNDLIERLSTTGHEVSERISNAGGEVTTTLNTLGQHIVSEIETHGATATGNLTTAGEKLVAEIADRGQAVTTNLQEVGGLLRGSFEETSQAVSESLASTGETIIRSIVDRSETMNTEMRHAGDLLVSSLGTRGDEVIARLDDAGARVSSLIAERGELLAGTLDDSSIKLKETLSVQGETLQGTLSTLGDQVASLIAERAAAAKQTFDDSASSFTNLMDERAQGANLLLANHVQALEANLRGTAEEATSRLAEAAKDVVIAIATQGGRVNEALAHNAATLATSLNQQSDMLSDRIGTFEQTLLSNGERQNEAMLAMENTFMAQQDRSETALRGHADALEQLMATRSETINTLVQQGLANFDSTASGIEAMLQERDASMRVLIGKLDADNASQISIVEEIVEASEASFRQQSEAVATAIENARAAITGRIDDFNATMAANTLDISARLGRDGEALVNALETQVAEADRRSIGRMEAFASQIATAIGTIEAAVEKQTGASIDTLRSLSDQATTQLQQRTTSIHGTFTSLIDRIETAMDQRSKALGETMTTRTLELAKIVGDGGRQLTDTLDATSRDIETRFSSHVEAASRLAGEINTTEAGLTSKLETSIDVSLANIEERGIKIASDVAARIESATAVLDLRGDKVTKEFVDRIANASKDLEERGLSLADTVSERMGVAADAIAAKTTKVDELLKSRIGEIDKTLVSTASELARTLGDRTKEIREVFNEEGHALVTAIDARGKDLHSSINDVTVMLDRSIGESAEQAIAKLQTAADSLRTDTADVLERLSKANELISTMVSGATNSLATVETDIVGRMTTVASTITDLASGTDRLSGDVAARVEGIRAISATVLNDANEISASLENRTKAMMEATQLLTTAQGRINDTLEDKQQALSDMVDQVSSRAQNLEAIIRSFTSLVDESMRNAETRARQVGTVLAEQSALTVDAINDQYETIRKEGTREHQRTLGELRSNYEDAMKQANDIYGGLGSGFQSALDELRDSTARIRKEIETARTELKRGATELPREAEATTAAVRRIVSDQVKALSELTDIVGKANRGLDVSEPRYQVPRSVETRSTEARRPAPASTERPATRGNRDRNGWLSELLSRASDEPTAPAPARSRATPADTGLDSIMTEIGSMIDETPMLDAWDRYRRGERTAFSRRLYTSSGQQTFDEIRRRYRRDTEFRDNVDAAVDQFDGQLRDISAGDRSGRETDRFLGSDAGKVYTLLAHASGRLD
jgi:uncharacterized protein with GYD domain